MAIPIHVIKSTGMDLASQSPSPPPLSNGSSTVSNGNHERGRRNNAARGQSQASKINEGLNMDKRKLLQLTGKTVRETLIRQHGKIFVWSAKGEIFLKKDTQNAPRVTVRSEKDLHDIVHGLISLDAEPEDEADNQTM